MKLFDRAVGILVGKLAGRNPGQILQCLDSLLDSQSADGFRVMDSAGQVFGERTLCHAHADEQPFTRGLFGVPIRPSVRRVTVQARDRRYGWGGNMVEVVLPGR